MSRASLPLVLAAVLEMQLASLAELEAAPSAQGITDESFDAIPTVDFAAPCPDAETLDNLSTPELRRLAFAHHIDDASLVERDDIVMRLSALEGSAAPVDVTATAAASTASPIEGRASAEGDRARRPTVSQPSQCSICMGDFQGGEELKMLPCSELHVFHTECIQQWLTKQSSCPLCRSECGERREPPPRDEPPDGLRSLLPLEELLAGLSQHAVIAQLPGSDTTFLLIDHAGATDARGGGGGGGIIFGGGPMQPRRPGRSGRSDHDGGSEGPRSLLDVLAPPWARAPRAEGRASGGVGEAGGSSDGGGGGGSLGDLPWRPLSSAPWHPLALQEEEEDEEDDDDDDEDEDDEGEDDDDDEEGADGFLTRGPMEDELLEIEEIEDADDDDEAGEEGGDDDDGDADDEEDANALLMFAAAAAPASAAATLAATALLPSAVADAPGASQPVLGGTMGAAATPSTAPMALPVAAPTAAVTDNHSPSPPGAPSPPAAALAHAAPASNRSGSGASSSNRSAVTSTSSFRSGRSAAAHTTTGPGAVLRGRAPRPPRGGGGGGGARGPGGGGNGDGGDRGGDAPSPCDVAARVATSSTRTAPSPPPRTPPPRATSAASAAAAASPHTGGGSRLAPAAGSASARWRMRSGGEWQPVGWQPRPRRRKSRRASWRRHRRRRRAPPVGRAAGRVHPAYAADHHSRARRGPAASDAHEQSSRLLSTQSPPVHGPP